jgi:hypothetical protein
MMDRIPSDAPGTGTNPGHKPFGSRLLVPEREPTMTGTRVATFACMRKKSSPNSSMVVQPKSVIDLPLQESPDRESVVVPRTSTKKLKSALGDIVSVFAHIEAIEKRVNKHAEKARRERVYLTPVLEVQCPSDEEEVFDLCYDVEIRRLIAQGKISPEMAPVQLIAQEERTAPRERRYVLQIVTSRPE